jgi:hypothetical protein
MNSGSRVRAPRTWDLSGCFQESSLRLRVRVSLHRRRLDREIAEGRDPAASPDRALRAGQLTEATARGRLARSLRRVVADTDPSRGLQLGSAVPVCRAAISGCGGSLLGLADALERSGPVNPCGVARTLALITDGIGPLYNPTPQQSLGELVWWVADGLQPCPPHAWASPVIMKLDPEHVAWTCGRCGAIALSDDLAVRPA